MTMALIIVGATVLLVALAGCLVVWTFGWGDEPGQAPEETPAPAKPRQSDVV